MSFFAKLACMPFVRTLILKGVRHGLTAGGGALLAYLAEKGADPTQAGELVQYLIGAGVAAAGIILSMMDANNVDNRLKSAAETGQVLDAKDAAVVQQSKDAIRAGEAVKLPSGYVVVGTPSNVLPTEESAETAALNKSQIP